MKYLPIILETFSFLLITFDLYNRSETVGHKDSNVPKFYPITISLSIIGFFIMIPCIIINYMLYIYNFSHLSWNIILLALFILFIAFVSINIFVLLTKWLSNHYSEKNKSYFLSVGYILFIASKVISAWLLDWFQIGNDLFNSISLFPSQKPWKRIFSRLLTWKHCENELYLTTIKPLFCKFTIIISRFMIRL